MSGYSPEMQATLAQLGFFAAGYCPAMIFEGVERLDVVRMVKLGAPWSPGPLELLEGPQAMMELVERAFEEANRGCTVADVARGARLLQGLGDHEIAQLHAICHERAYGPDETIFAAGAPGRELHIVVEGTVAIVAEDGSTELAEVRAGEIFGEMALTDAGVRSASAVCRDACTLLVIDSGDLHHLMDRRPAIGRKIMHNLAHTLSRRLREADRRLEWQFGGDPG